MLPGKYQPVMRQTGQYLSVIPRLFCSSKTVDVTEYRKLCETLYLLYLQSFPSPRKNEDTWVRITPSLHKLLGHSWELIELNDDCELKNLDESGLEANNKLIYCSMQFYFNLKYKNLNPKKATLWHKTGKIDQI